ncbi:uncharacterized protein C8A04DRAFT_8973 [Dichotomopilus funicola]|uniref:Transcriptional regulatory protein RXT2 N-terminal domain-containing protein n=1 Tax=Dichotomopilus funicola TaxID=1934379 RepID=A0AAN6VA67_9PEZI|nr:hypothetical protein C8A04DRAFT_8973 [Dichotomopilus funicola]
MASQQQALVMETILAFRRTLKRKAYDSDSDSSIDGTTNRGNKLKKRARFVRQGRMTSSMGPAAYKQVAEHAGYHRSIIHRNPPLIDEDGYDIESDDDEEQVQEALASALEENPYANVRLEDILAPLTAVTDLPSHPTFSRPYTSKALDELIEQGRNLMQKENKALWKAKPLLTKMVGDNTWAPCGLMAAPDDRDALLFSDTASFFNRAANRLLTAPSTNGNLYPGPAESAVRGTDGMRAPAQIVGQEKADTAEKVQDQDGETLPDAHANTNGESKPSGVESNSERKVNGATEGQGEAPGKDGPSSNTRDGDGDVDMAEAAASAARNERLPAKSAPAPAPAHGVLPPLDQHAPDPSSPLPESLDELFIHPLFRLPPAAHPDRDLGLPEQEAEEVRRLLLLYVQKQEEICRGTTRLYEGLLRADRLRKTVWQWSKAEAHCGPDRDMSDGEDWYDREAWGLTEDLKKGEDEVEEEAVAAAAQTQKKTRNRK